MRTSSTDDYSRQFLAISQQSRVEWLVRVFSDNKSTPFLCSWSFQKQTANSSNVDEIQPHAEEQHKFSATLKAFFSGTQTLCWAPARGWISPCLDLSTEPKSKDPSQTGCCNYLILQSWMSSWDTSLWLVTLRHMLLFSTPTREVTLTQDKCLHMGIESPPSTSVLCLRAFNLLPPDSHRSNRNDPQGATNTATANLLSNWS